MLSCEGGSSALRKTFSMLLPSATFVILILRARLANDKRNISGCGFSII